MRSPSRPSSSQPPARRICSGTQWPTANGGSSHSSPTTRTGGLAARRAAPGHARLDLAADRSRRSATTSTAASSASVIAPTVEIVLKIPSIDGRLERDHGHVGIDRPGDLVHLAIAHRADRAQLLGEDQVRLGGLERRLVELVERRAAVDRRRRRAGRSRATDRAVRSCELRVTVRIAAASGGQSHSWVTPTSSSPSPSANTISVAEGRSETIRIGASAAVDRPAVRAAVRPA